MIIALLLISHDLRYPYADEGSLSFNILRSAQNQVSLHTSKKYTRPPLPQRVDHFHSLIIAVKSNPMILPGAVRLPAKDEQPLACLFHLPAILRLYQCVGAACKGILSR